MLIDENEVLWKLEINLTRKRITGAHAIKQPAGNQYSMVFQVLTEAATFHTNLEYMA